MSRLSQTQNVEAKLESLKGRIIKLEGSYLEEVVAKMAMNCFTNYQKLDSMKNLLKVRIKNLSAEEIQPHLYKYYYDYLIKIAKLFKCLDEEISLYDVLAYINKNDEKDYRYAAEGEWIAFGKASKLSDEEFTETAK